MPLAEDDAEIVGIPGEEHTHAAHFVAVVHFGVVHLDEGSKNWEGECATVLNVRQVDLSEPWGIPY